MDEGWGARTHPGTSRLLTGPYKDFCEKRIGRCGFEFIPNRARTPNAGRNDGYLWTDNWDDWFEFSTLYVLTYFDVEGVKHEFGGVKIGQFGMAPNQRRPGLEGRALISAKDCRTQRIGRGGRNLNVVRRSSASSNLAVHDLAQLEPLAKARGGRLGTERPNRRQLRGGRNHPVDDEPQNQVATASGRRSAEPFGQKLRQAQVFGRVEHRGDVPVRQRLADGERLIRRLQRHAAAQQRPKPLAHKLRGRSAAKPTFFRSFTVPRALTECVTSLPYKPKAAKRSA